MGPNQKQKDMAVGPKPKLIVYIIRWKKDFDHEPKPKKIPAITKKSKKGPEWSQIKTNKT